MLAGTRLLQSPLLDLEERDNEMRRTVSQVFSQVFSREDPIVYGFQSGILWLSIMIQSFPLLYFLVASRSLAIPINGRRNPQDNVYVQGPSDAVVLDLPSATAVSPPTATGGLYGSKDLLGYGGNPVSGNDIVEDPQIVPGQLADPIEGLALDFTLVDKPQAVRGTDGRSGGTVLGPDTSRYDRYNSDVLASPGTDTGGLDQAQWPMGLSHNRLGLNRAGWARQQNAQNLPRATEMAGVDFHLAPNAYRELHWHQAGEWGYVFNGSVRVALVDESGQSFVDDLNAGDVWFFPPGVPHSIQAFDKGSDFLLVFDDGFFSEDDTSLVTEMFLRNPRSVMAKDLRADISALDNIPKDQLYIFPGTPPPSNISEQNTTGPAGPNPINQPTLQYTYHFSQQPPLTIPSAGTVKIVDPATFPAAADISAALVTIRPGAMRELHWHPQSDEWNFFLQGSARITIYQAPSSSQTFDYGAGDVGYIPMTFSHYIENTGAEEDVVLLEMLKAPRFSDVSVAQWLGLTPRQIVKDTLHLPDSVLDNLPKYKPYLISGPSNLTDTNYTKAF
ncbi:MAG: hypothetical protein LQ351_005407 [Letrouitia transgressa]|nr:MAG: hypothetical protein LQ351_005407 [Letrouitia transgressa]